MNPLNWLVHYSFQSVSRRENDWLFIFDRGSALEVSGLWRLVDEGRIVVTDNDDGHKFGLPQPIDAEAEVNRRLANCSVESVILTEITLDLELRFDKGPILQVFPTSAGYESWILYEGDKQFIAGGRSELSIYNPKPPSG